MNTPILDIKIINVILKLKNNSQYIFSDVTQEALKVWDSDILSI